MSSNLHNLDILCPILIDFLKHFDNGSAIHSGMINMTTYYTTYYNSCPNYIAYMLLKYKKNISSDVQIHIGSLNRKKKIISPNIRLNKLPTYYDFWKVWYTKYGPNFSSYNSLYNSHYPITITYPDDKLSLSEIESRLSNMIIEIWQYMNDSEKALWINPLNNEDYDRYSCKRWIIIYYSMFKNICVKRTKKEMITIMLKTWKFIKSRLDYKEFSEYTSSIPYIKYRDSHKRNSKQHNMSYINKYISAIKTVHKFLRMKRFIKYCNSVQFWHPNNIGGKLYMKSIGKWLSNL
jgi:hypothetical protein